MRELIYLEPSLSLSQLSRGEQVNSQRLPQRLSTQSLKSRALGLIGRSLLVFISLSSSSLISPTTSLTSTVTWAETPKSACPQRIHHKGPPEGTSAELLHLNYWRARWAEQFDLEETLLTNAELIEHSETLTSQIGDTRGQIQLQSPLELAELQRLTRGRLDYMLDLFNKGEYIKRDAGPLSEPERQLFEAQLQKMRPGDFRVALRGIQIQCGPLLGEIERITWDRSIDRNACTQIRPQALVQVIGEWGEELLLVRTRLAMGWISRDAALSPPVPLEHLHGYLNGPFGYAHRALNLLGREDLLLPAQARAPLVSGRDLSREQSPSSYALIATPKGFERWAHQGLLSPAPSNLTRGAALERLFSHLHKRYGLGGMGGDIDCSRVLIDTLEPFGLSVPRYSGHQAHMGSWSVDLSGVQDEQLRERILDAALRRGFTILYIPGHMMVYLGRDHLGVPRAFHALSDYQRVCAGGGESTIDIKRVSVTDLQRGAGSKKGAYLNRITRVVVLGETGPGPELRQLLPSLITERARQGLDLSASRACPQPSGETQLLLSERSLVQGERVEVAVTHPHAELLGHLELLAPNGTRHPLKPTRMIGPPYILHAQLPQLDQVGKWRLVFGEGAHWRACRDLFVSPAPQSDQSGQSDQSDLQVH